MAIVLRKNSDDLEAPYLLKGLTPKRSVDQDICAPQKLPARLEIREIPTNLKGEHR